MSKVIKDLVVQDLKRRLDGVNDAVLVNVIGLNATQTFQLRKRLREHKINVLVVKNSLAKRAAEGLPLHAAFDSAEGSLALVWGGEDFISLVKVITDIDKKQEFPKFEAKGGVLDGEPLSSAKVKEISKWPNRVEQLSLLLGQILSPGARLLSQLNAPGGALASQIKQKSEEPTETP